MTTLSKINKRLKREKIDAEILSDKGKLYFAGPAVVNWELPYIDVNINIKNLTTEQGFMLFFEVMHRNSF